jgi:hypothetical protein
MTVIAASDAEFFQSVADRIQQARRGVERQVNTTMALTYHEIGRRIVEKE